METMHKLAEMAMDFIIITLGVAVGMAVLYFVVEVGVNLFKRTFP